MQITAEQVYDQHQIDKRNFTNQLNAVKDDVEIALLKTSEIQKSVKIGTAVCLSSCEINQIVADYVSELDIYLQDVDQSTCGQLTFISTDPEVPPIVVDLTSHVQCTETDTVLAKVPASLQLEYSAERHTDLLDFSDWFVASNVQWSGTPTGRPTTTTQNIIDEIVLAIDDTVDCGYFTGGGVPAYTLALDDLSDVNVSGVPISIGDFLMFDGNNWVPNQGTINFDCSLLATCGLTNTSPFISVNSDTLIREDAGTGQYNRDFVIGSPSLSNDGDAAHFSRVYFDKSKGAFRAGMALGNEFDQLFSGDQSAAFGNSTRAITPASFAKGKYSVSYLNGQSSQAYNDTDSVNGQNSELHAIRQTNDATTTELTLGGGSPSSSNRILVASNTTWTFSIFLSARQMSGSAGTNGDSAGFKVEGIIKKDNLSNVAFVGTPAVTVLGADAAAAAWTVAVVADGTSDSLRIDVTGEANKTIHWSANIRLAEVGDYYGGLI